MKKETIYDTLVILKRAINVSKALKAIAIIEKAVLLTAVALSVGELMMIVKRMKG